MDQSTIALLGIILTVTGVLALVITAVRGPNLGLSRRTGYIAGVVLLVLGVALLKKIQHRKQHQAGRAQGQ